MCYSLQVFVANIAHEASDEEIKGWAAQAGEVSSIKKSANAVEPSELHGFSRALSGWSSQSGLIRTG
jgi:hypothetical protein